MKETRCFYCGEEDHKHTECPVYKACPYCSNIDVSINFDCKICENSRIVEIRMVA